MGVNKYQIFEKHTSVVIRLSEPLNCFSLWQFKIDSWVLELIAVAKLFWQRYSLNNSTVQNHYCWKSVRDRNKKSAKVLFLDVVEFLQIIFSFSCPFQLCSQYTTSNGWQFHWNILTLWWLQQFPMFVMTIS